MPLSKAAAAIPLVPAGLDRAAHHRRDPQWLDAAFNSDSARVLLMREGLLGLPARWPGQGVRISAQARLRNFYAAFGFVPSGDVYLEDGIDHLEMACAAPSEAIEPVGIKETQR